jgi:hypothetical protein
MSIAKSIHHLPAAWIQTTETHRRAMQEPALHQTLFILAFRSRIDSDPAATHKRRLFQFGINHRANRDVKDAIAAGFQYPIVPV